jgi:hypothetical protein
MRSCFRMRREDSWTSGTTATGFETPGRQTGHSEAELPGPAPHDGDSSAEHGISERYPGAPTAREGRHHRQRVHAGAPGERSGNGRFDVLNARKGEDEKNNSDDLQ